MPKENQKEDWAFDYQECLGFYCDTQFFDRDKAEISLGPIRRTKSSNVGIAKALEINSS